MIVGTAGHIDHGKTSLIKRLTGRDTDRLPEEIKRGISIELGYAYVPVGADTLGFVDVPGHERFVHTMLAGATGIDFALLVVAADDGVMPQTDEHLEILMLLGLQSGAIALTKIDAVPDERVDEVRQQLAARTADTAAADWPVFPVSSLSGDGIDALKAHLLHAAERPCPPCLGRLLSDGGRPLLYVIRRRHGRHWHRACRRAPSRRIGQHCSDSAWRAHGTSPFDPRTGPAEQQRRCRSAVRAQPGRTRKSADRARDVGAGPVAVESDRAR